MIGHPMALAAAALVAMLAAAPASATNLHVGYRITLAGLSLGQAELDGKVDAERYSLQMKAQLTGIAGLLSGSGRGGASATGTLSATRPLPSGFSATGRSGGTERTVQIGLQSGSATSVEIVPPFEERPDRVPVTDAHRRGIIDPLGAMVAVTASRAKGNEAAACNRTLPVFDGTQRFNIVLSFVETRVVQKPGFTGNVVVCSARYVPIAGHRPLRPSVKFMEANRDMSVWLAPVEGTRVLVPIRIAVQTMVGMSVVEVERWNVD